MSQSNELAKNVSSADEVTPVQFLRWRVNPKQLRLVKFGLSLPLLGLAGWLVQNFLQLRGVVNLPASRVVLYLLTACLVLFCFVVTEGVRRKWRWRISITVALFIGTLAADRWVPKPSSPLLEARSNPSLPPTAAEIADEVAKKIPRQ